MRKVVVGLIVVLAVAAGAFAFRKELARFATILNPAIDEALTPSHAPAFAAIVKRVAPAVVTIIAQGKDPNVIAGGSGFVIDADGYIVTNDHVIDGARKIEVLFENGKKYKATLVGTDKPTDVALLKVSTGHPLAFVQFGDDRKSQVGDWVLAMGSPDFKSGTVTAGILSARGRDGVDGGSMFTDYLQIDAAINHGNSGGPTFNLAGEVIGVNVLASYNAVDPKTGVGERNEGLGFAIPSSTASVVVKGLRSGHFNRGLLGVFLEPLSESDALALGLKDTHGALVTNVIADSPAAQAGVKKNDVILKVDGVLVTNDRDCLRKISLLQPGQSAAFAIWRDKAELDISVTVVSRESLIQAQAEPAPGVPGAVEFAAVGVTLRAAPIHGLTGDSDTTGVFVQQVAGQFGLAGVGLRKGDRITAVGSKTVTSLADVTAALETAKSQNLGAVLFYVETPMGGETHTSVRLK